MARWSRRTAAVALVLPALLLAACGGSNSAPVSRPAAGVTSPAPPPASSSTESSSENLSSGTSSAARPSSTVSSLASGAPVTLDDATKAKLQKTFEEAFATPFANGVQTAGAIAYVSVGGQEWLSALGVSDVNTRIPIDPRGQGRIGSISKPFVATTVLRLVADGQLSLDDTLGTYITGIPNGDAITIRQLLSMSAGVWSYTSDSELIADFQSNPMSPWTIDETIDLIRRQPAAYPPGEKQVYSDSNYVLLGRIIQVVTGQPVSEVITSQVIEPLGLTSTRMPADDQPGVPDPSIGSYMPVDGRLVAVPELNPDFAWTAGAMTSTAPDLAVFAKELVDGTLLPPELQAERLTIGQFDGAPVNTGYGLGLIGINNLIGHTGAINGGGGSMLRLPEPDATFVVLVNASSNFENTADIIASSFIKDLFPEEIPQ